MNMDDGLTINAQMVISGTQTPVQMKFFEDIDFFRKELQFYQRGCELECFPQVQDMLYTPA